MSSCFPGTHALKVLARVGFRADAIFNLRVSVSSKDLIIGAKILISPLLFSSRDVQCTLAMLREHRKLSAAVYF